MLRANARLVILDEPFRGLDRDKRRDLLTSARRWWRQATLFCITHDVGDTRSFDFVKVRVCAERIGKGGVRRRETNLPPRIPIPACLTGSVARG